MKLRSNAILLSVLACGTAWGQEVSVYGTTMAQMWKSETLGFDKASYAPATQYLGIDATKLGSEALSLHLFGWGTVDLADSTKFGGKSGGELTYGYLEYRFATANAVIKAGRFTVNQGVAIEQVDGVSARADLRGGFTISAFGGRPVLYKTVDAVTQQDYEFQRDFIFGTRLGLRVPKIGEFGLSYLQDGTEAAKDLPIPSPIDYTRKQMGFDLRIAPHAAFDFSGRTVLDLASRADTPGVEKPSKIAEHDYKISGKISDLFSYATNFSQRNFNAFFAGTNLPSLFRPLENDKYRGYGGSVTFGSAASYEVVVDFRHTHRESYGDANRFGAEVRWNLPKQKLLSGFGYRKVTADDVKLVDPKNPSYSLSHSEMRAWVMYDGTKLVGSLDGIFQNYDDQNNPHLNGKSSVFEVVASLGIKTNANLKFSGDVSYASNPFFKKEVRGLLRAEYRFGMGSKGGSK